MKEIEIEATSIQNMIEELCAYFDTECVRKYGEFSMEIPEEYGTGIVSGINFPNGVGTLKIDCCFKTDLSLVFLPKQTHTLKFLYCVKGKISQIFGVSSESHDIEEYQHVICASGFYSAHHLIFKAGQEVYLRSLDIDRYAFQQQLGYDLSLIDPDFYPLFADINAVQEVYHSGYYGLKVGELISELDEFGEEGLVRSSFLGAKALEILSLMLLQLKDDMRTGHERKVIRRHELRIIDEAVKMIDSGLMELGTVEEIARQVGTNTVKLQEGFKILYKQTVNEYIQNRRLQKSMELLSTGDYNVSEVAQAVGISSRSYFAKIFKTKYNIAPGDYLQTLTNGKRATKPQ